MWEAVVLGFVQGLTEFLPISSSGHLRVIGELIGSADPGAAFTAITQIGTETAVLIYFRKDIARILTQWWRALRGRDGTGWSQRTGHANPDARMGWWIILGSLPIVVLGLIFQDAIESSLRSLYLVALMLALFAIILGFADHRGKKTKVLTEIKGKQALAFGFAQALALIPGVSRSGGTITAGLLMGFTRQAAARYSFLLAIPAVMGSGIFQLIKSYDQLGTGTYPSLAATAVATIVAFIVGYYVIIGFLKLISTRSFMPFVIYRVVAAVIIVVLLSTQVLNA